LLHQLAAAGQCVLDLEALACHRGSVIGGIGMPPQPLHQEFAQCIADFVAVADPSQPIWVEDEGAYLGSVGLPVWLQLLIARSPAIVLQAPMDIRLTRLAQLYECEDRVAIANAVRSLAKRVGRQRAREAADLIASGNMRNAIASLLPFYDEAYEHRNTVKRRPVITTLSGDPPPTAQAIVASQRWHTECHGAAKGSI
jgi:tRNA 2-selenouridine synthase